MDQILDNNNSHQGNNNQNSTVVETLSRNNANELINKKNDSSRFKCNDCDNVFLTEYQFKKHMKFQHTREYPYKCKICDYACDQLNVFNNHMNRHKKDKPHKCLYCKFETIYANYLEKHMNKHLQMSKGFHEEAKRYSYRPQKQEETKLKCDHCPYTCYLNNDMMKHKKQIHKIKQHKCPHCDYETDIRKNFNVHMQIHSDEKPFKCNICGRAFKRKFTVLQHLRMVHEIIEDCFTYSVTNSIVDNIADNSRSNENEQIHNFVEEDEKRINGKVEEEEKEEEEKEEKNDDDDDPVMKPPAAKKAATIET